MGSSSTMLIIPSPLDAKWKPSDRRTLATERKSDLQDFSTHTVSFKCKNDCTLHPKIPSFSRQGDDTARTACVKISTLQAQ